MDKQDVHSQDEDALLQLQLPVHLTVLQRNLDQARTLTPSMHLEYLGYQMERGHYQHGSQGSFEANSSYQCDLQKAPELTGACFVTSAYKIGLRGVMMDAGR